jgi:carboxypeptidase Taq
LERDFPAEDQLSFAEFLAARVGYDFERGRQDLTAHPFEIRIAADDVRITTRVNANDLPESLLSTVHEAGHAMYEQAVDPAFDATPLGRGASAAVHESQSRLWENMVGRSRGFWNWAFGELQRRFPDQVADSDPDQIYVAMNTVQPSLIRTEADEVTYNLHVMIRFDLELQMLEGDLSIADLPEAWADRYEKDLGIRPPDFRDGVMQDVHWYGETIGGTFQGYTLGNILSGQFLEAALAAHPEIPEQTERGEFGTLRTWLADNIHRHGRKFTAEELVTRVTGKPFDIGPYINYLETKFSELYQL